MVVHPSLKNLFGWKLKEITKLLTILKKTEDLIAVLKINCLCGKQTNYLPDDSKNKIGSFIQERLRVDTNNLDQTSACRKELIQVLPDLVDVKICTSIDGSHIDSVRVKLVKKM
jgi:hypothetical protein